MLLAASARSVSGFVNAGLFAQAVLTELASVKAKSNGEKARCSAISVAINSLDILSNKTTIEDFKRLAPKELAFKSCESISALSRTLRKTKGSPRTFEELRDMLERILNGEQKNGDLDAAEKFFAALSCNAVEQMKRPDERIPRGVREFGRENATA